MSKGFIATIILVLLASMLNGALLISITNSNPLPQNPFSAPPIIIQSPFNSTYYQNDILLNFTVVNASKYFPMAYHLDDISYRLDEKLFWLYTNPNINQLNTEQFSANLTGLSKGEHTLTVHADGGGLYYINNSTQMQGYSVESIQTVTFTVAKDLETTPWPTPSPSPSPSPSPTPTLTVSPIITPTESPIQTPTLEPSPTPNNTQGNSTSILIIAALVVAAVVVSLLVYFAKRKREK